MAKFIIFVVAVLTTMALDSLTVECRSLPPAATATIDIEGSSSSGFNKLLTRIRRGGNHLHRGRKPGDLLPTNSPRDEKEIADAVSATIADGVLCKVPEAMPGTKIPCSEGKYVVEWSPVKNGAANINVYSALGKVNRA